MPNNTFPVSNLFTYVPGKTARYERAVFLIVSEQGAVDAIVIPLNGPARLVARPTLHHLTLDEQRAHGLTLPLLGKKAAVDIPRQRAA